MFVSIECSPRPGSVKYAKSWGHEIWHYNRDLCVKTLTVNPGKWCSLHLHREKKEIFLIESGSLNLEIVDTTTGKSSDVVLNPGDMYFLERMVPHRFTAKGDEPCVFKEFSTHHEDSDSYRILPSIS